MSRTAEIERGTNETQIKVGLDLDGGDASASTGVGFFDHMLDLLARHGNLGLTVEAKGDLETGSHHTVEDVGIVIGQAIDKALGDRSGIRRYGSAVVPMDEARASCALDISGRPFLVVKADYAGERVGDFDTSLTEEFFRALAFNAGITLHLSCEYGTNDHHKIEAMFKAFARALRVACAKDKRLAKMLPSTKGLL